MDVEIDVALVPRRSVLDTGVVIRALGNRPADPASPTCRALWRAMEEGGRPILIAAPTVAEIVRGGSGSAFPSNPRVEILNFDLDAAQVVGQRMPDDVIKQVRTNTGLVLDYLKYDAMILACAARHRADCIVTLDERLHPLAAAVGLQVKSPSDFIAQQGALFPNPPG